MDKELKELLRKWDLPDPSPQLDARVMGTYFKRRPRILRWTGYISLPVPVFLLLIIIQLVSAAGIVHYRFFTNPLPPPVLSMPERIVEIPVLREKVVTQIVYLPARTLGNPDGRPARLATSTESEKPAMDLTGFQPVSEFHMNVIKGGNRNER
jgi:hypothetical protein